VGRRIVSGDPLPPGFYERPVLTVARELLGAVVVSALGGGPAVAVRLTEVEAYDGLRDPGSHAFRGRTRRNATMFGPPGRLYVYFTYGMHWCINAVCGPEGDASAVLLRAGEVLDGVAAARDRRGAAVRDRDLARGPARLAAALGVTGVCDGLDVTAAGGPVRVLPGARVPASRVERGPRVGVGGDAAAWPWRFAVAGDPTVSVYRPAGPRRRAGRASAC
jgi:DNA-3-methyladenine glycosylase